MAITDQVQRALWGRSGGVCARCRSQLIEDVSIAEYDFADVRPSFGTGKA